MITIHTLISMFIVLCIVGLILWGIGQIPGLPPVIKTVVYVIVGIIILSWLRSLVGGGVGIFR